MKLDDQQLTLEQMKCKHKFKPKFYPGIGYRGTSECIKCQAEVYTKTIKEKEEAVTNKDLS